MAGTGRGFYRRVVRNQDHVVRITPSGSITKSDLEQSNMERWIEHGLTRLDAFMANQAAFLDWCQENGR